MLVTNLPKTPGSINSGNVSVQSGTAIANHGQDNECTLIIRSNYNVEAQPNIARYCATCFPEQ